MVEHFQLIRVSAFALCLQIAAIYERNPVRKFR